MFVTNKLAAVALWRKRCGQVVAIKVRLIALVDNMVCFVEVVFELQ